VFDPSKILMNAKLNQHSSNICEHYTNDFGPKVQTLVIRLKTLVLKNKIVVFIVLILKNCKNSYNLNSLML